MSKIKKAKHTITAATCSLLIAANGLPVYAQTNESAQKEAVTQVSDTDNEDSGSLSKPVSDTHDLTETMAESLTQKNMESEEDKADSSDEKTEKPDSDEADTSDEKTEKPDSDETNTSDEETEKPDSDEANISDEESEKSEADDTDAQTADPEDAEADGTENSDSASSEEDGKEGAAARAKLMILTEAENQEETPMLNAVSEEKKEAQNTPVPAEIISNGQSIPLILDGDLGEEDSEKILGDSWLYGVVADTFTFNGEAETNFAVKTFEHAGGGDGQTGVTDKGYGSKKAWFVAGELDAPFMVKGIGADITVPGGVNDWFKNSTQGGTLDFNNELTKEIINEYVTDLRNDARAESARLAARNSVKDYTNLPQNQMTLDVTSAGTHTVYLNVDAWAGLKKMLTTQSSGIKIKKNPGQKIVLNFPESDIVTTQKIEILQDGKQYDSTSLANVSTHDVAIASDIILNMPKATSVKLNDTTGIILAPEAEVRCYGVDAGWINCRHMINECEWHFINGQLPEQRVLGARRPVPKHYGAVSEQPGSETSGEHTSEQPGSETPGEHTSVQPGSETPGEHTSEQPGSETPGEHTSEQPGSETPGEHTSEQSGSESPKENRSGQSGKEMSGKQETTSTVTAAKQADTAVSRTSENGGAPRTGDQSRAGAYGAAFAGSLLILLRSLFGRRRRKS